MSDIEPATAPPRPDVAVPEATLRTRRVGRRLERLALRLAADPSCTQADTRTDLDDVVLGLADATRTGSADAHRLAARALDLADEVRDAARARMLAAAALDLRSWALLTDDLIDDAGAAAAEAEEIVLAGLPDSRAALVVVARVHCGVAAVAGELEELETALAHLTTALDLDTDHDLGLASAVHANIAFLLAGVGESALALPYLDRALEAADNDEARRAALLERRAELLMDVGDLAGALLAATAAAQHAQRCGLPAGSYRRRLASVQVALGDLRALDDLRRLADEERAVAGITLDTAIALARALVVAGGPDEAVALLDPYAADLALAPVRRDAVADTLVEAHRRTGRLDEALVILLEQRDRRREHARIVATARVLDVSRRLDVALLEGDLAVARAREADLRRLVRQRTEELTWRARHDHLTGLLNREAVTAIVAEPPQGQWRTVAFADVDRFKVVNDAHGHAVGDTVLMSLASRLAGAVSVLEGTCRVARVSADQFVVVADTPGPLATEDLARVVRDALAARVEVPGIGEIRMSVSLGIAQSAPAGLAPDDVEGPFSPTTETLPRRLHADLAPMAAGLLDGDTLEPDLLRDAEVALHRAKADGGGTTCVFGEGDLLAVVRRFEVEHAVRTALAEGRVVAGYDPIVDLADGRVVGVEALARLDTGSRRVVAGEFIEIAEESGLVEDIGEAVGRQALADLADAPRAWFAALNLGAAELRRPEVVETLESRAAAAGLGLDRIVIEVTERSFVDVASSEADVLVELARRGVGLAIDDFSTGHSSMVHMSWMPLTLLKIDRSLVIRAAYSSSDRILVSAVVSMANALGLKVVAEGVESAELFEIVRELGCDYAQGHLFGEYERIADVPAVFRVESVAGASSEPAADQNGPATARPGATREQGVTQRRERLAE